MQVLQSYEDLTFLRPTNHIALNFANQKEYKYAQDQNTDSHKGIHVHMQGIAWYVLAKGNVEGFGVGRFFGEMKRFGGAKSLMAQV